MSFRQPVRWLLLILMYLPVYCGAQEKVWQALYVFGDSYSDSGAGYVDGNGPTAVVYLAQHLGIPFTYAGDPDSKGKSLNFAVSGAQTGGGEGMRVRPASAGCGSKEALLGRGMRTQVLDFAQRVKSGSIGFPPDKTLFFIAGGLNDGALPTETTVTNLTFVVRQLYDLGGRYFLIALLPERIPPFHAVATRLNPALSRLPESLHAALPGASVSLARWGEYFDEVLESPRKYGITDISEKCAGREVMREDPKPCSSPDTHFYFHDGHPSTAVHRIVGRELQQDVDRVTPLSQVHGQAHP